MWSFFSTLLMSLEWESSLRVFLLIFILAGNAIAVSMAWYKVRLMLLQSKAEIKDHAELVVNRLNGMLSYVIQSFDKPCWLMKSSTETGGMIIFRMLEYNKGFVDLFGCDDTVSLNGLTLDALNITSELKATLLKSCLLVWASGETQSLFIDLRGRRFELRLVRIQTEEGDATGIFSYITNNAGSAKES